jgi:hypothetical protein
MQYWRCRSRSTASAYTRGAAGPRPSAPFLPALVPCHTTLPTRMSGMGAAAPRDLARGAPREGARGNHGPPSPCPGLCRAGNTMPPSDSPRRSRRPFGLSPRFSPCRAFGPCRGRHALAVSGCLLLPFAKGGPSALASSLREAASLHPCGLRPRRRAVRPSQPPSPWATHLLPVVDRMAHAPPASSSGCSTTGAHRPGPGGSLCGDRVEGTRRPGRPAVPRGVPDAGRPRRRAVSDRGVP